MTTPDTTEAVAKALYESEWGGPVGWEASDQDYYRQRAQAAIQAHNKAMRELVSEKEYPAPLSPEDRRYVNGFNEARNLILGEENDATT